MHVFIHFIMSWLRVVMIKPIGPTFGVWIDHIGHMFKTVVFLEKFVGF